MRATILGVVVVFAVVGVIGPTAAGAAGVDDGIEVPAGAIDAGTGADTGSSQSVGCTYPLNATDATGTEVTVRAEPDRIVTLAPSGAQTLWELGAQGKVVGLTDNALYLEGADEKTVVAEGFDYQVETIVGLEPDLVLAPNTTPEETVEALRANGLTVHYFGQAEDFEDVYAKTELIGRLAGECEAAEATVTDMRQRVDAVRQAVSDEEHPGSMYVFFGFTAGDDTFIDAILETAGTTNVAAEVGISGYREVNEEVVANNSDAIEWLVLNSDASSHPGGDVYEETTALQDGQTVVLNKSYLNQPAPRTVLALETLTRAVHPEAYEEAQAILASTPTSTDTVPDGTTVATATATPPGATTTDDTATATATDDTATSTPADTTADGPGFGLVAAVLALLAVAVLGRRR